MNSFERAAELFERLLALPAEARAAELSDEPDVAVRELASEMLAGEADPYPGLETGIAGAARWIDQVLEEQNAEGSGSSEDDVRFKLEGSPFRILGVLARGGMGVVLRGRDEQIGRDVAIKVLRPSSKEGSETRLRFIEEAQVAGQLEHPGIVPVYHMGTDDFGQPFFVMKLVEGETLEAHLKLAVQVPGDRVRLVSLFLQVCQTVAYAHARNVIHRDLKPANVMIGAFGEVQVLDWGIAKVLGAEERALLRDSTAAPKTIRTQLESGSGSLSGTVMGTPRYMPPEQAQGEVERLDRRSDVFSLGAILCEILTGEPPFPDDREEAIRAAREAQLEPAYERLSRCGANPELVDLARRSLAARQEDRPADAAELASAVEASIAGAESRARAAEIAAEAARAGAAADRRARRMTLILSSAAGFFLVSLATLWALRSVERERQSLRSSGEVAAALDLADERFELARRAAPEDLRGWDATALALETATSIAGSGDITPIVRQRLEGFRAEFDPALGAARSGAARIARNRQMSTRLDEIRMPTGDGIDPYDYPRMEAAYRQAFAAHGIDLSNADAAHASLANSDIRLNLAQALDQWALCHQVLADVSGRQRREQVESLLLLATAADPDPVRNAIRSALIEHDRLALQGLADQAQDLEPESSLLLGGGLRIFGDDVAAAKVLRSAAARHPGGFWLSLHAALAVRALSPSGASEEAIAWFRGALGARPASLEARHLLGQTLLASGNVEQARRAFEELVRLAPDNGHWLAHLGEVLVREEGRAAALETLERSVKLAPKDSYALSWYGRTLQETGDAWRAASYLRRASDVESTVTSLAHLAGALSATGDYVGASAVYDQALALDPNEPNLLYNAGTLARELGRSSRAESLLAQCVEVRPEMPQARCNLGWVLADQGRFEEALEWFESCDEIGRRSPRWNYPTEAWISYAKRAALLTENFESRWSDDFDPRAPDAFDLIEVARALDQNAEASRAYERMLEAQGNLSSENLELAACAAIEAATGSKVGEANARNALMQLAVRRLETIRARLIGAFRLDPVAELVPMRGWLQKLEVSPIFSQLERLDAETFTAETRALAIQFRSDLDGNLREIRDYFQ